ncbi:hypothetical protein HK405_011457, partial [Cladochytrium tenue]
MLSASRPAVAAAASAASGTKSSAMAAASRRGMASNSGGYRHVAVIGAGLMGSGIAQVAATAGLRVTLVDASAAAAAAGLA